MSRTIAFLSGKGGSGKTTLALTIATMLSSCEIKVLLIDCDLLTNGATYFYEDLLQEKKPIMSFEEILFGYNNNLSQDPRPIEIVPKFYDFIPSIRKVSKVSDNTEYQRFNYDRLDYLFTCWNDEYDVILFDCSAGYSDVLKSIIPKANINFVVLEADKVSMAAMRSLYLKVGEYLHDSRFYQIYNKIRPGEEEKYIKRDGTFFTNIGALPFDWSIRDAFSVASVPIIDNTNIEFANQLNKICNFLFQGARFQSKLTRFGLKISLKKTQIERDETQKSFISYKDKRDTKGSSFLLSGLPLIAVFLILSVYLIFNKVSDHSSQMILTLLMVFAVIFPSIITYELKAIRSIKERQVTLQTYTNRIDRLEKSIEEIEKQLEEQNQGFVQ